MYAILNVCDLPFSQAKCFFAEAIFPSSEVLWLILFPPTVGFTNANEPRAIQAHTGSGPDRAKRGLRCALP